MKNNDYVKDKIIEDPRLTKKGLKILGVFMDNIDNKLTGSDVMRESHTFSGTVYPILIRFEKAKWLKGEWEKGDPKQLGRPLKKYYKITALGKKKALSKIQEKNSSIEGWSHIIKEIIMKK